jgi:MFS family permease
MGLLPDGDEPASEVNGVLVNASGNAIPTEQNFTVREALGTRSFWLILVGVITRVAATNAIIVHIFPILSLKGLDERTSSAYVAAMFLVAIPLRFLLGIAGGKFSSRKLLFWGMSLGAFGIVALWSIPGSLGVVLFIVGLSIVEGITSVNWLMVSDYFGRRRFATLMGVMSVFHNLGMFISPLFAGFVRDYTESYDIVLLTFAPVFIISAVSFAVASKPNFPDKYDSQ